MSNEITRTYYMVVDIETGSAWGEYETIESAIKKAQEWKGKTCVQKVIESTSIVWEKGDEE